MTAADFRPLRFLRFLARSDLGMTNHPRPGIACCGSPPSPSKTPPPHLTTAVVLLGEELGLIELAPLLPFPEPPLPRPGFIPPFHVWVLRTLI